MRDLPQPVVEITGRAMGSSLHIVAVGDPAAADAATRWARTRIEELESRWSRFVAGSDVTRLNEAPDTDVAVSSDTLLLIERALEARELSGGRFDPTMLQAMHANGYDRTFVSIRPTAARPRSGLEHIGVGAVSINHRAGTARIGAGTGFDPGGIGKGLAADLVAEEMVRQGISGAMVNIGGDLRCVGRGPDDGWTVEFGDHVAGVPNRVLRLQAGGVATSTRARRRWKRHTACGFVDTHHLLDPATQDASDTAAKLVTVVAARCADAEWLATSIAVEGALPVDRSMLGNATVLLSDCRGGEASHGQPEEFLQ